MTKLIWSYWPKTVEISKYLLKSGKIQVIKAKSQILIFPGVRVLIHSRRLLGEELRKFSVKTNDKIWSYQRKTFKKWHFWAKWPFFDSFWPKTGKNWIFFKNLLQTFFYIAKALTNCKVSEKLMNGYLDNAWRTYVHL